MQRNAVRGGDACALALKQATFYEPAVTVYAILISFKIVVVFNTTLADFVLMLADVVLKTTIILKEMRIAQLSS